MQRLRDVPVKSKLQLIALATIAASLLMAGAGIILSDVQLFRARMERDLSAVARIAADNSTAALAFDDPRVAADTLAALRALPHLMAACVYRLDGTVFARYSRPGGSNNCEPPAEREETRYTGQGLIASRPIALDNRRIGTLVLRVDLGEIAERIRIFAGIVLIVLLASSVLAFLISSGLWAGVGEPISHLARAAASVQTGDYRVRVEQSTKDELGMLAGAFNKMLDRVHARDIEIQTARDSLETTLNSIGDAVISTDAQGTVVFANPVARSLLRWPGGNPAGRPIEEVFRIANELTREEVEVPIRTALRQGKIAGLANHTVLVAGDGTEIPIDDTAAPVRSADGAIQGAVLVFRDITERRRADATWRLLASVIDSSGDAIITEDLDGVITTWNRGAQHIFGYTPEEAVGQSISMLAPPERHDEMPEMLQRIRRGEPITHYQTLRRTKSGKEIHASISISPLHDARGCVIGGAKIARDVTAEHEAQAQVAVERERLRVTLASIGDAVIATDAAAAVSYLNPVAEELTGWTSEEAAGRPLDEVFRIVNEFSRETVESPVARVLREGNIVGLANHTVLISRNGNERAIDDSAAPIRDNRGEIVGVVLIFRDITGKRAAEKQLAQQTDALREALQRLRLITDNMPIGVTRCSRDFEYVWVSRGYASWLRQTPEEVAGHPIVEVIGKQGFEEILPHMQKVLAGERAEYESLVTFRGAGTRWIHGVYVPTMGADREVDGWIAVVEDITDRKAMEAQRAELLARERALASEEALRQTEAELARVVRALSVEQLASSIAHEINQPLAGVITNAAAGQRWLGADPPNLAEAKSSLVLVERDGNRAAAVIRRIRDFLKKEPSPTASLDINETIRETAEFARTELLKRQVALRMALSSELPRVEGDRVQLQQVILNLIMNGAEAMDATGGPKEMLITSSRASDGEVSIAVRDAGTGIKADEASRMFTAFFTTKPKGMGMGLSISRAIVEAHGGRIWAERNEGPGLTVRVVLPAGAPTANRGPS